MVKNTSLSGRRAEVLRILRGTSDPLGVAAIAGELQVHPNTVRFHLDALVGTGHAERVPARAARPGRPPALFQAVRPVASGPRNYRLLADMLVAELVAGPGPKAHARRIGRRWGRHGMGSPENAVPPTEAVDLLVRELERIGFAPDVSDNQWIDLRNCPFLDVVRAHGQVVCDLHLGFLQGALQRLGTSDSVVRLIPFVEAEVCRVVLTTKQDQPGVER
ncbi:helix-turn-helix transcriptional regulator [Micromonosporaceae bacterium Da 78-11]